MTEWIFPILLIGSGLVLVSVVTSLLAFRFGAPLLLVFLGIGLLAGEDGLGIRYDDAPSAYFVGSLALAVILFDSGFGTRLRAFRQAASPAIVLATVGVVLTAAIVAIPAYFLLDLSWLEALLMGAIVGSTDAAAVFFLLRVGGITIKDNVRSTLEVESGSNDPMAIFLTTILVEFIVAGGGGGGDEMTGNLLVGFVTQMGIGVIFGLAGGFLITAIANRMALSGSLYHIGVLSMAIWLFALTGEIGGSGFLAVYVAGLVAGNRAMRSSSDLRRFLDGMTWMAQITMFLILGLLATPSDFLAVVLPAVGTALVLIFIARPVAVALCLLPFGYRRSDTNFIGWVGLRGAVSILLAIIPLAAGVENGQQMFNAAYIMVLTSLLVQGWSIRPVGRWMGVVVPQSAAPAERVEVELPGSARHELIVYHVVPGSPVLEGQRLPRWARPSLVIREGQSMRYQYAGRLQPDDYVYMFIPPSYTRLLDRLFASPRAVETDDKDFFGEFSLDPRQPIGAVIETYGTGSCPDEQKPMPIGDFMLERLGGTAEVGDRVAFGEVELIIREVDVNGAASAVGIALDYGEARDWKQTRAARIAERIKRFVATRILKKRAPESAEPAG